MEADQVALQEVGDGLYSSRFSSKADEIKRTIEEIHSKLAPVLMEGQPKEVKEKGTIGFSEVDLSMTEIAEILHELSSLISI